MTKIIFKDSSPITHLRYHHHHHQLSWHRNHNLRPTLSDLAPRPFIPTPNLLDEESPDITIAPSFIPFAAPHDTQTRNSFTCTFKFTKSLCPNSNHSIRHSPVMLNDCRHSILTWMPENLSSTMKWCDYKLSATCHHVAERLQPS
jgi:hypothetical protein